MHVYTSHQWTCQQNDNIRPTIRIILQQPSGKYVANNNSWETDDDSQHSLPATHTHKSETQCKSAFTYKPKTYSSFKYSALMA